MVKRKSNLPPAKTRAAELSAMNWDDLLSALEGERFASRRDAIIGHLSGEIAEKARCDLLEREKTRQRAARASAKVAAEEMRRSMRAKHPDLIDNPDLASRSAFFVTDLDRWFLTGDDRAEARRLRKGFLTLANAASLLGVSAYRLDKMDRDGTLPHCRTKSLSFSGKHVQARVWAPASIIEFKERIAA